MRGENGLHPEISKSCVLCAYWEAQNSCLIPLNLRNPRNSTAGDPGCMGEGLVLGAPECPVHGNPPGPLIYYCLRLSRDRALG